MNKQTWALAAEGTGGGLTRLLERVLRGASFGMALSLLVAVLPAAAQAQNGPSSR
jgi:type IV pilus assembly protein PilQ